MDIALNDEFDVFIDHRGDLATVEGREAFEQQLILWVQERFTRALSEYGDDEIIDLLEVEAERVAEEVDRVVALSGFNVEFSDTKPNTVIVEIIYDTGEITTFEVQE
jgi:hypothetical protein